MKNKKIILSVVIVALFAVAGIVSISKSPTTQIISFPEAEKTASFNNINASELLAMLEKKDFTLINVHTPYAGEISNTDSFIPFNKIEENIEEFPSDKNTRIVFYCRSGGMSAIAAKTLADLGYTNVENLSGGMIAWEQEGYSLVRR